MPISYRIDHERRVVFAAGHGILTDEDVFGYQKDVWSRQDIVGYSELMDMRQVERIVLPSSDRVRDLADLSARMDSGPTGAKFAIVAVQDFAFGLGRMYEAHRHLNPGSTKQVGVFRTLEAALGWLGIDDPSASSAEQTNRTA